MIDREGGANPNGINDTDDSNFAFCPVLISSGILIQPRLIEDSGC